ncbi:hypothetical protein [Aurantimonas sp. Leaf443]|uniref:hypothetical protein n=1 Tax=Aurantimonas sp. Leaf443 TaxID=1736378 RepID=UPI0006F5A344|nr:hypothetical protein [Aurantimonas sp. Leaf443]KQT88246.1 hypothetical protein ASG48_02085 [Aurantimonas sp. Leaf443]
MRNAIRVFSFLLLTAPLTGCLTGGVRPAAVAPLPSGAAALGGGLVGQTAAGKALKSDARSRAVLAEYQALQFGAAGVPVAWSTGSQSGEVVPTQLYRVGSQDCRGYSHAIDTGKGQSRELGTACRTADGNWKTVG